MAAKLRTTSSIDNKSRVKEQAKLLGHFSPEAHFSKMIHTGKKSLPLSSDELSVLSVSSDKETLREGGREGAC